MLVCPTNGLCVSSILSFSIGLYPLLTRTFAILLNMSYWTKRRKINASVAMQIASLSQNDCEEGERQELLGVNAPAVNCYDGDAVHLESTECDGTVINSVRGVNDEWLDDDLGHVTESDDSSGDSVDIVQQLRRWAAAASIKQHALSELLHILQPRIPELPKDARTLMYTPTTLELVPHMKEVSGGLYYHFGISDGVVHELQSAGFAGCIDTLLFQLNIDGVPLFKSSNGQFWPILGKLVTPSLGQPFVIGIFYGESKPKDLEFLDEFVEEYKGVMEHGIHYNGTSFRCNISAVICDAPARAFVKNVKGHTSYSACERCVQSGVWNGKMTLPEVNARKRTDVSFDELSDEEHHRGTSPMSHLGIGMVSQFVLDYMHLVCLGVMRRLICLWLTGPVSGLFRLRARTVNEISESLVSLRKFMPCEFARKPRSLLEWQRWKATEFRQFLLYTGPVSLFSKLSDAVYNNFMLLFVGVFILLDRHLSNSPEHVDYAEQFVRIAYILFAPHLFFSYAPHACCFPLICTPAAECRQL